MKALVLSTAFPNPKQPTLGVFVEERVRRVARHCELVVVGPVPWFPLNPTIRGPRWTGIPATERRDGLRVYHPRIVCVPRFLKWTDGLLYAASLVPFLARLRRAFPFELIDAHFIYPDGLAAVLLGKIFRCPVVVTLRGSIVRLSGYRLHRPQIRWALERAAAIIAVSQSLKTVAVGLGIAPERIRVIPNGVDALRFRPRHQSRAREACGLPADRRVILTVGAIYEHKGQHLVLEALAEIVAQHPDLLYVMVGEPRARGDRERLDRIIHRAGLADHVRFAGPRAHHELPDWYAAADLFCLPTRSEGWANVLLEALACGLPVVATRVGGNPEIVTEGRHGFLVSREVEALKDALLRALETSWDRDALVGDASAHTWEGAADHVLEEFERVAAPAAASTSSPVRAPGRSRP